MKACDLTFRIEIETSLPKTFLTDGTVNVGRYHAGLEQDWLPPGWNVQSDGSLAASAGYFACEIVSPVLKGEEGLCEVVFVMDTLWKMGAKSNASMGLHVHVGAAPLAGSNEKLRILIDNFMKIQTFLRRANGNKALTRASSRYCKPGVGASDRYHELNLTTLPRTVEFRLWRPVNFVAYDMSQADTQAIAVISLSVAMVLSAINGKKLSGGTREEVFRELFSEKDYRIVDDGEFWDILLHVAHQHKVATV